MVPAEFFEQLLIDVFLVELIFQTFEDEVGLFARVVEVRLIAGGQFAVGRRCRIFSAGTGWVARLRTALRRVGLAFLLLVARLLLLCWFARFLLLTAWHLARHFGRCWLPRRRTALQAVRLLCSLRQVDRHSTRRFCHLTSADRRLARPLRLRQVRQRGRHLRRQLRFRRRLLCLVRRLAGRSLLARRQSDRHPDHLRSPIRFGRGSWRRVRSSAPRDCRRRRLVFLAAFWPSSALGAPCSSPALSPAPALPCSGDICPSAEADSPFSCCSAGWPSFCSSPGAGSP